MTRGSAIHPLFRIISTRAREVLIDEKLFHVKHFRVGLIKR
jgi:hypothetical protein